MKNRATQERLEFAATILDSSMAFTDRTVVDVALPALQRALHASIADVHWVESVLFDVGALLLVGGSPGDALGPRKVYVVGISVFAIASSSCGLARNLHMLI